MRIFLFLLPIFSAACSTSTLKFDSNKIRPWSSKIESECPHEKAVIAHYQKGDNELFYLAARHTTKMGDDTLNLVQTLFAKYQFNVLVIESIPNSEGESPRWFIEEAKKGKTEAFIKDGESALAAILADEKKVPFYAGEPDHEDIYRGLKGKGYSDIDVVGFYTVRQVPQWARENEKREGLLERKIPSFINHYCKIFSLKTCPSYVDIMKWYKIKLGHDLIPEISNQEVAPYADGTLFTQKISFEVGNIRNIFTLNIIQQLMQKYKKVAVVYGAGHFISLRNSFDEIFGEPKFIEDRK